MKAWVGDGGRRSQRAAGPQSDRRTSAPHRTVLSLQRAAGNRAVAQVLAVQRQEAEDEPVDVAPLPEGERPGETMDTVVVAGQVLSFQGRTNATPGHSWATTGDRGTRVGGVERHAGTLVSTFTMATRVTLPDPPPDVSDCVRERAQAAIDGPLAEHEQQHVAAFDAFAGSVETPYDQVGSAARVTARLEQEHRRLKDARWAQVQAASARLDPFRVDVDLSECE